MAFACPDRPRIGQIPSPSPVRTVSITKKAQEPAFLNISPLCVSIFSLIIRKLCDTTFISVQSECQRSQVPDFRQYLLKSNQIFSQFSPKLRNAFNCRHISPNEADGKSSIVIQLRNSSITAPCIQISVQKINETLATATSYLIMSFKNE